MPRPPMPWALVAPYLTESVIDKFWSKVDRRGPDECWLWQAQCNQYGYGMYYVPGIQHPSIVATRVAYYLTHGAIADDKFVCHTCDTPPCCNPAHLWLGTHAENLRDMTAKGRRAVWNRGLRTVPRQKRAA